MMRQLSSDKKGKISTLLYQCYSVPLLLLIYPISLSAEFLLIPNHHRVVQECQNGTSALPCLPYISFMKKWTETSKDKSFEINSKIEDVVLNEDIKSTETRNGL